MDHLITVRLTRSSLDNYDFTCANVGANTVTLTVVDVNGNISTCTSTITVQDNINPTAICQNLTVQLDANGQGIHSQLDKLIMDHLIIVRLTRSSLIITTLLVRMSVPTRLP